MSKSNLAVVTPTTDPNLVLATQAITLKREIDRLTKQFEKPKKALIDAANGETMNVRVPGQGSVTVTAKTESRMTGDVGYTFNPSLFLKLDPRIRRRLIQAGVVSPFNVQTGGANPSLRITLNV